MHRLAATPGGWNPDEEGVIFIAQNPASIVFLTAADTEIQTIAASISSLPSNFPDLRVANLLNLQQQLSIDTYGETVLAKTPVIILRLLGGRAYWSYGLEVVKEIVEETKAALFVLPGDDRPDPDLIIHSTVGLPAVNQLWRYLIEGGRKNYINGLKFVANICFKTDYKLSLPEPIPRIGFYPWQQQIFSATNTANFSALSINCRVGIIFYRSHYLANNTLPIDTICYALQQRKLEPIPLFISSLRETEIQVETLAYLRKQPIEILLNTTSFSLTKLGNNLQPQLWQELNIPVLQTILSGSTKEQWSSSILGLTPRDVAINVALPEVDGRIITRAISFKSVQTWNEKLETDVVVYQPESDRVNFVADLAANWVKLKQTPPAKRKVALILANYPNKDGRIANGVGLDTLASCIEILKALYQAGYQVENIPATGEELIQLLTSAVTNDPESRNIRSVYQSLDLEEYQAYFATLPQQVQQEVNQRWGNFGAEEIWRHGDTGTRGRIEVGVEVRRERETEERENWWIADYSFPIPGIQLGNIFIGIQPSRGYDLDPSLNYHAPDLEPTHAYLAYYYWLRAKFQAQAIIHVGKHGNLEWLPGKGIALSANCYPEIALQTIPNIYPFIVNDPGEGSQAKRRSHAVIIDHLTPPLTRAELYGGLAQLEALIDEYYEAQTLDPSRLKTIGDRITQLVKQEKLDQDLGIDRLEIQSITEFLTAADGYLCELKEAQIRDGLHILGKCPQGRQLRDLTVAIARSPRLNQLGLTQAIAKDLGLDFDPLMGGVGWGRGDSGTRGVQAFEVSSKDRPLRGRGDGGDGGEIRNNFSLSEKLIVALPLLVQLKDAYTVGDAIAILEEQAAELVAKLITKSQIAIPDSLFPHTYQQLQWIQTKLLPSLQQTNQEITNLLKALDGKYVPSGASGAPTRGRPEVLPTGRNFYSVDIRAIPTETAWEVGRKAAEAVIERYTQENGEYPRTLAISIWGTSTMRTGGDDIAQVMALMGVRPLWDGLSRRVVDFEILSPSILGRPRVDVTVRVSGCFRDSFPNILDLLNQATQAVANLSEELDINPLAAQVKQEQQFWQKQGLDPKSAQQRASYRIFGSKPGAYGAGLQGLIEAQNWQDDEDLARAYINWSAYAYDAKGKAESVPEVFTQRLKQLQVVLHNQDNREHDLLDSDDYYQFQGGLTAAVRSVTGSNPTVYFGDNSLTTNPRVRKLSEEIARVYRSRVVNPKWIAGVMRHGYKGAFEMAATVDYLFAYAATTKCVPDHMYQGVAQAYLLDEQVQQFVREKNPWALRDMAERLLEAKQRGLWQNADTETLEELRNIVNQAEGVIEELT